MKKTFLILVLLVGLAACSKSNDDLVDPAAQKEQFFSKVRRYKDNRQPSVDTMWTLRLISQNMVDSFQRFDGKIYWEDNYHIEQGVMWSK